MNNFSRLHFENKYLKILIPGISVKEHNTIKLKKKTNATLQLIYNNPISDLK